MTLCSDLPEEERRRELRLCYVGAIMVLVGSELRAAAARLLATYPLFTEDRFVEVAREAFRHVAGEVVLEARDARCVESPATGDKVG